ncbi:MAG: AAA family ATPase [Patescibacteria group bacterium]
MRLTLIELSGFKSFAKKTSLEFASSITSIVGPNGSGKSNVAESFRFVLGEQSMKSMRGRRGEDLIWNGSANSPRAGRASVRLVFDNSDRALNLDFDEVSIERVVHRDGQNDYLLNGSQVRLRDLSELLAQANIGASGHHIISQGEADRILSTSSRERREMIEDALGLTAYLYKREEAERKLEKTGENMHEVDALRRELSPHLKFLQSQVKKIEDSHKLRDDLAAQYLEYLKREQVYLKVALFELAEKKEVPEHEHHALDKKIEHVRGELGARSSHDVKTRELMDLEEKGRTLTEKREHITRELGRIEGELHALQHIAPSESSVPLADARTFGERIEKDLTELQTFTSSEVERLKNRIAALLVLAQEFLRRIAKQDSSSALSARERAEKKSALERGLEEVRTEEARVAKTTSALRRGIESEKDASREAERELFAAMARRSEIETVLSQLRSEEVLLSREKEDFNREVAEAGALLGGAIVEYESQILYRGSERLSDADIVDEGRIKQEERRRKLERMKIRLEESGLGNSEEVLKEFKETGERDAFLARELDDLAQSAEKLRLLIEELTKTLEVRFTDGIEKINTEFDAFFKLMFGGGSANLQIVKEHRIRRGLTSAEETLQKSDLDSDEVEIEEGIEITVTIPHKRVKGLHMLSGGERALTSIALIFAMSQVNPPPFLILDETDAALDEANSRRYGDMIENLSKKSQLILITHNRETMSRAGVLYGVTMGQDGISKLLSVKFEEALAVAK